MPNNIGALISEYWHIGVVAVFLAVLTLDFFARFFLGSCKLRAELGAAIRELTSISDAANGEMVDLNAVKTRAMKSEVLSHLWAEYVKTLHPQMGVKMNWVSGRSNAIVPPLWLMPSSLSRLSLTTG